MKKPPARSKRAGVFELFAQKFKVLFIHRTLYQVPQGFFWVAVKVKAFHTSVKLPRCAVKVGIPVGIQLFSGTGCEIQVFQQIIKFLLKCFGIHGEKQFKSALSTASRFSIAFKISLAASLKGAAGFAHFKS